MSTLLEQVVEDLQALSREEQDRAAEVLLAFLDGSQDDFRGVIEKEKAPLGSGRLEGRRT